MDATDVRYVGLALVRVLEKHCRWMEPSDRFAFRTTKQEIEFVQSLETELNHLGYKITKE